MIKLFNFKKRKEQPDAERLYEMYNSVNDEKRIQNVVEVLYKKMIILGEEEALKGNTSFIFELEIDDRDKKFFNIILHNFITKLVENKFKYSRHLLNDRHKLTVYFSKTDTNEINI